MKSSKTKTESRLIRLALICLLTLAIAFASLPFTALMRKAAKAESVESAKQSVEPRVETSADVKPIEKFKIRIMYYRPDNNYTGWNIWLWSAGKSTADYTNGQKGIFSNKLVSTNLNKRVSQYEYDVTGCMPDDQGNALGFIVRLNEWESKDVGDDRFITVNDLNTHLDAQRVITVWLVSGVKQIFYNGADALKDKITTAYFADYTKVDIATNAKIGSTNKFVIKDNEDNECGMLDCSLPANSKFVGTFKATIPFTAAFDFDKTYTVHDVKESGGAFDPLGVQINKLYDTQAFQDKFNYDGALGVEYSKAKSTFVVWAPTVASVKLNIYASGDLTDTAKTSYDMVRGTKGEWKLTVEGDLNKKYYTYTVDGNEKDEIVDPYARSGGKDGKRGMILDLAATDPTGWDDAAKHSVPDYGSTANAISKAVIWEAQLRDVTIHPSSGVSEANRGKFLGLTETGTTVNGKQGGKATALDYLKQLGVTQVHFQPLFDFASVEESFKVATYDKNGEYNWGYDPLNYNMPEGSYSSDPSKGEVRVNEMKQMVMALHNAGIQVIMDVVYNHVSNAAASNFEKLVPGYYFRTNEAGGYWNGSGCGNETASERHMFRRFMIDSVKYWTEEYKIDGFRFDLMGLHDIVTMNDLYDALAEINPDVIVYGEGWTGGDSGLSKSDQAIIANASRMPNVAVFNDIIRDGIKGSVFDIKETGFVSGKGNTDAAIYVGAAGGTAAMADKFYNALGKSSFAANPSQNINYVSAHDNSALWDKMNASVNKNKATIMKMYRMAATSVLTSQGASFFLAGEEMMRSKPTTKDGAEIYDNRPQNYLTDPDYYFSDNSYKSADSVNAIDWSKLTNKDTANMVEFYKQLIAVKKTFPQFHFTATVDLKDCLTIKDDSLGDGVAGYAIKDKNSEQYAVVLFNATDKAKMVSVPSGKYNVHVDGARADAANPLYTAKGDEIKVSGYSAVVMVGTLDSAESLQQWGLSSKAYNESSDGDLGLALGLGIGIPAAVLIAGGAVFGAVYGKKKGGKKADASDKDETQAGDDPENGGAEGEEQQPDASENAERE